MDNGGRKTRQIALFVAVKTLYGDLPELREQFLELSGDKILDLVHHVSSTARGIATLLNDLSIVR